jgi:hypothetical protein
MSVEGTHPPLHVARDAGGEGFGVVLEVVPARADADASRRAQLGEVAPNGPYSAHFFRFHFLY